ncbi:DoxX family protein [bacterium]|nr:DoxX family protein [bacterium]
MKNIRTFFLLLLRIAVGWIFAYEGFTRATDSAWTLASLIGDSHATSTFFAFISDVPEGAIQFFLSWGSFIAGAALIIGAFVRIASLAGILIAGISYFSVLRFPFVLEGAYIIDEHVVYMLLFVFLAAAGAGKFFGVDGIATRGRRGERLWIRILFG